MKILVIGSGGREHALVWKIAQSKLADTIFCAPGNAGISGLAQCVDIKADDIRGLLNFSRKEKIDLTVVGPEVPLALGIADEFAKKKLKVFGPGKKAALLEASKVFSKNIMLKYQVPTALSRVFSDPREADEYIELTGAPCVIKADGMAAGKGVVIARTIEEARGAVDSIMRKKIFGDAGKQIIIEECLLGQEASILVFTDGKDVIPMVSSQDHKRIFDGDAGPNTGGMGAYSPASVVNEELFNEIIETIVKRTLTGLARERIFYKGVLYAGIMVTDKGPKALEFNVRFGDPETEAVLPRLKSDLVEIMLAVTDGNLRQIIARGGLDWDPRACVSVVISSEGYPNEYKKDKEISGLDTAANMHDVVVFHAGTRKETGQDRDRIFTSGGRVLAVTGLGGDIKEAIEKTYTAVRSINFEGMHYRKDIGARAIV